MATVVNLNFGAEEGSSGQTYTADLVLTSPYVEPSGNLLVLRSASDIGEVAGTWATTEAADLVDIEALNGFPLDSINGTLATTAQGDTASFLGETGAYSVDGTWETAAAADTASFLGDGFVGIAQRIGILAATESADTATATAAYDPKWVATVSATEPGDIGAFSGAFIGYTGPGFLNTTDRPDTADFTGRILYDVDGTLDTLEAADSVEIIARTRETVDAESTDTVLVSELLIGNAAVSLVDRFYVTDQLDYTLDANLTDIVGVSETLVSGLRVSLARVETLRITDRIQAVYGAATADVVVAMDSLQGGRVLEVADTVVLTETLTSRSVISGVLSDQATATDELAMLLAGPVTDVVMASETLDSVIVYGVGLSDTVAVTEVWTGALNTSISLADTLTDADVLESSVLAETVDTINVTDSVADTAGISAALADTGYVTDSLLGEFTVYAPLLSDQVGATDSLTSGLVLVGLLADTVWATDVLYEVAVQTVYVVNAETGAVSTYAFTPVINGMAEYQGVLYLSGPDGLYALDAAQDDDGDVVWTLRTGFSNLGTDKLKRVHDCNFQARTEGDTTFQVVSDRYGQKQEWNYRLPPLTRDSYRDGVVKVGRGIQSVYWQFAAQGIGPAEIDQLRLVVEPLSRRK